MFCYNKKKNPPATDLGSILGRGEVPMACKCSRRGKKSELQLQPAVFAFYVQVQPFRGERVFGSNRQPGVATKTITLRPRGDSW